MPAPYNLIAAVHTPFDSNGDLNVSIVERQAELLLESGAAGVFPGGSTGESLSLTLDERFALAKQWVDVASGTGLKVIVHVGHNSIPEAVALARQAEQIGADAIAAMPPSYFKPETVADLIDCMAEIAATAPSMPFYYYDIPSMTNVRLSMVEFAERAADAVPTLAGIKYSHLDLAQLQELLRTRNGQLDLLFGSDQVLLSAWVLGVRGAVGSTYNFMLPLYRQMLDAFEGGRLDTAADKQFQSVQVVHRLMRDGFLGASKALMAMLGVDCGPIRKPLRNSTPAQLDRLYEDLQAFEVFPRPLQRHAGTLQPK